MNKNFKRILAYMIDMIIVSIIVFAFTNIKQINPQLDSYNKIYKDYLKISEKYKDLEKEYNTAKKDYENKKINKKEYNSKKTAFLNYKDKYTNNVKKYNYKLSKNSTFSTIISIIIVIGYFGVFQFSMGGQTLGKKLLKLKVIKNNGGSLNIGNYLIRCVILNGVIFNTALIICIYALGYNNFYTANYIITNLQSILEIIILLMVFMSKDGRGLHDYLAQSRVIEMDNDGNEVEYIAPTKKREE